VAALLLGGVAALSAAGLHAGLDGLSGWALLPLFIAAVPAVLAGGGRAAALVGALLLAVLAADAVLFGLALAGAWAALRVRRPPLAAWAACFAAAVLLLAAHAGSPRFAAMRAAPPDGWFAGAVLLLVLLGLAALSRGLLHGEAGPGVALPAGVALYGLARLLLDLCGPATPVWWGGVLLAAGLGGAVLGGLRASLATELDAMLAASAVSGVGLGCAGLGVALAARGADLPPLAALGMAAALMQALSLSLATGLLALCAESVRAATGTTVLPRLGGLLGRMPATGLAAIIALASLAGLPLSAGFASLYLLLQGLLAGPRVGGFWLSMGFAAAVALAGLAVALGAAGAVRTAGLAFLGRPRSGRAAAAADPGGPARLAMAALAGLSLLLGLWPGGVMALAAPATRLLISAGLAEAPPYAPITLALMLAAVGGAVFWGQRLAAAPAPRRVAAWEGGLEAVPAESGAYLPGLYAASVRHAVPRRPRAPSLREALAAALAALAVALIAFAAR